MQEENKQLFTNVPEDLDNPSNELLDVDDKVSAEPSTPEDPVAKEAKTYGHLSQEDYIKKYGSLDGYKDEKQFVEYGRTYEQLKPTLDSLKKTISQQNKEIEALVKYQERVVEREKTKAVQEILAQLSQAKQAGDIEAVEYYSRKQIELESQHQQEQLTQLMSERARIDAEFVEKNKNWFNQDNPALMEEAQALGRQIFAETPNLPYSEVVRRVENSIKWKYPHLNQESKQAYAPPVISANQSAMSKPVANNSYEDSNKQFDELQSDYKNMYTALKRIAEKNSSDPNFKFTKKMFIDKLQKDGDI